MSTTRVGPRIEALERRRLLSVTSTTLFSEDFESGAPGWTVDTTSGIDPRNAWAIISPGYNSAHCAATANPGTNCILVSPPLALPVEDQYTDHLFLTFWSKQNYNLGGTPTPVIREYLAGIGWGGWNVIEPDAGPLPDQSAGWNYFGVDLGLFTGEVVEVGFEHDGTGTVAWSIDDVQIQQVHVSRGWFGNEGFENGWDGWTTYSGMWNIGVPSGGAPTPTEGTSLAGAALDGVAPPENDSTLWSPAFYMPPVNPGQHLILTFDSYSDGTNLNNVTWDEYYPGVGWSPYMVFGSPPLLPNDIWTHDSLDVTSLAGFDDPVRIGFDNDHLGGLGWFVDNVKLTVTGTATTASIIGTVFGDDNNNGTLDPGEGGQVGVKLFLDLNNDGILDPNDPTATASFTGHYIFPNLQPGNYVLREVTPSGWARTAPIAAGTQLSVAAGQVVTAPDIGNVQISTVTLNFAYLVALAQHYGQPGTFATGDLNGDGVVNFADLVILAQNYGHALGGATAASAAQAASAQLTPAPQNLRRIRAARIHKTAPRLLEKITRTIVH